MADNDETKIEPLDITPSEEAETATPPPPKGRPAFRKFRRELNEEELESPAVQRILMDDLERLTAENVKLNKNQEQYHTVNIRVAVLEERVKEYVSQEIMFGICLTIGAAIIGRTPWEASGAFDIVIGFLLILGGIASKVVKR